VGASSWDGSANKATRFCVSCWSKPAQSAARYDAELGRFYRRLAARKHRALAKVAVARKLAMRLYLMLREDWTYAQLCRAGVQASPSHSVGE
jgi:hypothetical protein